MRESRLQKTFHDRDGSAAYARHKLAVLRQHLDAYATGTLHFDALMNFERSSQLEATLVHKIGPERTCCRSGRSIFADFPRKHAARENGIFVFGCEAIGHRCRIAKHAAKRRRIGLDFSQCRAPAHGDEKVENARGNEFERQRGIEIADAETECACERTAIDPRGAEFGLLLRHGHANRTAVVESNLDRQNARACLLQDVNAAFLGRHDAELRQKKPRADHRMTREGQVRVWW